MDQYFEQEVFYVVDTVASMLAEDENRKFIYVETGFFARWWEQASDAKRELATKLVHGGLRYLEHYEFRLVREALIEREVVLGGAAYELRTSLSCRITHGR